MSSVSVWAPGAGRVDVVVGPRRLPMAGSPSGWWTADLPGGAAYRFSLDGGPPRPDPRSRSQPDGIEGPSAVVDDRGFAWHDGSWRGRPWEDVVLYELHVGTFSATGTFDGVIEHLDHLVTLGVSAIELLPVAEFGGDRGWGYDGVLLWAPHHRYGGPDGLKRLVDAAHTRGLSVVLDVVYNHLGPVGNHLAEFGPYFTDRYRTPWGQAVNFDGPGSDEVRRFVIDNASMWLEHYHLDGLRLDAVHAIVDESALHILEELAAEVGSLATRLGRPLWLIAESDRNDPRLVRPVGTGGYGLGAAWSDDFHHALHAALTGERGGYYQDFGALSQVARALDRVYVHGRGYSAFRDRHHGRPVGDLDRRHFVGYLQNHDQVGNRALGDRSGALLSTRRLQVGAALVLTSPFAPMLFQGEEWAASSPFRYFCDHHDPELARAVREGRRRDLAASGADPDSVPDPQDPGTWAASVLDWSELGRGRHAALLDWHRRLLALRRSVADLRTGGATDTVALADDDAGWLRVERGRSTVVAANLAGATRRVELGGPGRLLEASDPTIRVEPGAVVLPADSVAIVSVDR